MIRLLLVSALAAVALTQCPQPRQPCCSSEESDENEYYCRKVPTIERPMSSLAKDQPLCYTFLPNTEYWYQVDNICLTFFPLKNNTELYTIYESITYCDGSNKVVTYIGKSNGTGINTWANPDRTFTNYVMTLLDCGTFVKYRCGICGGIDSTPFAFGMAPMKNSTANGNGALSAACFRQATGYASALGLDTDDLFVLPNKLAPNCVYQQLCQPMDSPVYCQENGTCQAYESS